MRTVYSATPPRFLPMACYTSYSQCKMLSAASSNRSHPIDLDPDSVTMPSVHPKPNLGTITVVFACAAFFSVGSLWIRPKSSVSLNAASIMQQPTMPHVTYITRHSMMRGASTHDVEIVAETEAVFEPTRGMGPGNSLGGRTRIAVSQVRGLAKAVVGREVTREIVVR